MSDSIYCREVEDKDLDSIKAIDNEGLATFLDDPFTFNKYIIEDEKGIILVGMRRVVNEFKIIPNRSRTKLELARAINDVFIQGLVDAQMKCPTEIYAFITVGGDKYVQFLKKHFGFMDVMGVPLKIEL